MLLRIADKLIPLDGFPLKPGALQRLPDHTPRLAQLYSNFEELERYMNYLDQRAFMRSERGLGRSSSLPPLGRPKAHPLEAAGREEPSSE